MNILKKKWFRWCLGIIAGIVLLLFSWLNIWGEEFVKDRLVLLMKDKFKGVYKLDFDSFETEFGFSTFSVSFKSPRFSTDTVVDNPDKLPIMFFEGDFLQVQGFKVWPLIRGNKLNIESLELIEPRAELFIRSNEEKKRKEKASKSKLKSIFVGSVYIKKAKVDQVNFDNKKLVYATTSLNLFIENAFVDLQKLNRPLKAMDFDNFVLHSGANYFEPLGSSYSYSVDSLSLDYDSATFHAEGVVMNALESLNDISLTKTNQNVVPELAFGEIHSNHVDYRKLLFHDTLEIDSLIIDSSFVELYKNKTTVRDLSIEKKLFGEMIHSLDYPVFVNTIHIHRTDLDFDMKVKPDRAPMVISLDSASVSISNFNTFNRDTVTVSLNSKFLSDADLIFEIKIPLKDTVAFKHYFHASLTNLPFENLNEIVSEFAPVALDEGDLEKIEFWGWADTLQSNGNLIMTYSNLKASVLNKHHRKNGFVSMLANTIIRHDNPKKNGKLYTAEFHFERKLWQDQFMLMIGGMLDGIIHTVLVKSVQNVLDNKAKKKKQEE